MPSNAAAKKRKGGAPTKVPGGLDRVLFIRANDDLLDALDALVDKQRELRPGRSISRADIARELLGSAIEAEKGPKK